MFSVLNETWKLHVLQKYHAYRDLQQGNCSRYEFDPCFSKKYFPRQGLMSGGNLVGIKSLDHDVVLVPLVIPCITLLLTVRSPCDHQRAICSNLHLTHPFAETVWPLLCIVMVPYVVRHWWFKDNMFISKAEIYLLLLSNPVHLELVAIRLRGAEVPLCMFMHNEQVRRMWPYIITVSPHCRSELVSSTT